MPEPDVVLFLRSQGIHKLYHFTDKSNIQSIIDNNGLYSWKACQERGITVANPGGNDTSHSLDFYRGLENYVRLSFTKEHPMKYVAQNEERIKHPVVLEIDLSVAGLITTLFADRNATKTNAIVTAGYNGVRNIHFNTVKQSSHFNLAQEEKEYYQAEVLVLEKVPLACITNINDFRPKPITPVTNTTPTATATTPKTPTTEKKTVPKPIPYNPVFSDIDDIFKIEEEYKKSDPLKNLIRRLEQLEDQKKREQQLLEEHRKRKEREEEERRKGKIVLISMLVSAVFLIILLAINFTSN